MIAAALLVALTFPAAAQRQGVIELGAFAPYTVYDTEIGLDEAVGLNGRLGWYFAKNWAFEVDAGLTSTEATTGGAPYDNIPVHVRLLRSVGGDRMALLLGAGWAHNQFKNGSTYDENGVGGLIGLRLRLTKRIAIRGDVTADYMLDPAISADDNLHYSAQAGVSLMLRRGPGDKDKDGVLDNVDRCLATPAGSAVESTGCTDTDRDGVADSGDRCANTPTVATVDAIGCSDADGDGVVDPQDRCVGTAAGTRVDSNGCAMDVDRDGVPDVADRCSDTAPGVRVDPETGCALDADNDGIMDPQDQCLGTPAGMEVNAMGCPADTDGDAVPDATDECPGTAPGVEVNRTGCEAAAPVVIEGVSFLSGSARLTLDSQGPLNRVVGELSQRPDIKVVIEGHTDNVGNRDANIRLSKARADAVRMYFISKGIPANRITSVGKGPDQPIANNDTPEGRAKNRRVQLREQ
jgi:outer membrane protein OmpA-like peptidoglycan-associated protein